MCSEGEACQHAWAVIHIVHTVPLGDGFQHELYPGCPCGPTVIAEPGKGYLLKHASLDGRELVESPPAEPGAQP